MALATVVDLREARQPASAAELERLETDLLAEFVLARASAGLTDGTIRGDVNNLEQIRGWFGRPLWEMQPGDADAYFGRELRGAAGGKLTHRLLVAWLDHRRRRWPTTANQHLFISQESAVNLGPVSNVWVSRELRGLPAPLERLRIDRQLEEALTHGADPLHLAVVFGVTESTAVRYANNARQLLQRPHQAAAASSPRTQAVAADPPRDDHLGSP